MGQDFIYTHVGPTTESSSVDRFGPSVESGWWNSLVALIQPRVSPSFLVSVEDEDILKLNEEEEDGGTGSGGMEAECSPGEASSSPSSVDYNNGQTTTCSVVRSGQSAEVREEEEENGFVMPYFNLLRNNVAYRWIWLSNVISLLGDWLTYVASLTLLGQFGASGLWFSLLINARSLPQFFLAPVAGVLVDRFDRVRLMVISDIARAVVVLGYLAVRSKEMIPLLIVVSAIQMSFSSVFEPARSALIPTVIAKKDLSAANMLDGTTWSCMAFIGAAFGGFFTAAFGITADYIVDGVSFILSALLVSRLLYIASGSGSGSRSDKRYHVQSSIDAHPMEEFGVLSNDEAVSNGHSNRFDDTNAKFSINDSDMDMRVAEIELGAPVSLTSANAAGSGANCSSASKIWSGIRTAWSMHLDGWRYLARNPMNFALTLVKCSSSLVLGAINIANIRLAQDRFVLGDKGSGSLGALYAGIGIASCLAPIVAKRFAGSSDRGAYVSLIVAFWITAIFSFVVAWSPDLFVFVAANTVRATGGAIGWVFSNLLLQRNVPDEYRGRVLSFDLGLMTFASSVGSTACGVALDGDVPPMTAVVVTAMVATVIAAVWTVHLTCRLRRGATTTNACKDEQVAESSASSSASSTASST